MEQATTFEAFLQRIAETRGEADARRVKEAYDFASEAHHGQKRESGEAYIQHPWEVAIIVYDLDMDTTSIVASLLHDVVEDTQYDLEEIKQRFGPEVALLVDGVTKLSRLAFQSKQEQQMENLRKMFLAMTQDLRVIIIKLADRLHNMRTLKALCPEKQLKIAKETLEIYAPLAHRIGIGKIKWELEDLALRYIEPDAYYDLVGKVAKKRQEREGIIEEVKVTLQRALAEVDLKAEVQGRPKHFYSIYHKMQEQGKDFSEIYDLLGLRVIVATVQDCYEVLGIVHTLWKPIPGRFKDYVAMPKSNMYQSLHTTVIGPQAEPLEIQIRTWEMHRTAEYGIAAHWIYKQDGSGTPSSADKDMREKVAWLRHLSEWQGEMKDTEEFMETLRIGLFVDEVFVFTPKGEVKSLPAGSTPIDFAYSIHTNLGHQCAGAKVNGRLVPLDYQLKNGDIIQIITNKQGSGPSRDWLQFVKTSKAKNRIRQWLREQDREENIQTGREILERELRKHNLEVHDNLRPEILMEAGKKLGFTNIEDLLATVGDLKITANQIIGKLSGEKDFVPRVATRPAETEERRKPRHSQGIRVKGVDDLLIRFSRCCNPVPGDPIIGFITRGRGVSVHRKDCPNLAGEDPERIIEVEWDTDAKATYPVDIEIEGADRVNFLTDIMNAISEMRLYLNAAKARSKGGMAFINLTLEISHSDQITAIYKRVKKVEGVERVYRVSRLVR